VHHAKVRLDAFLATKMPETSRARLQASIKEGMVEVNGRPQPKASYAVRSGDAIRCSVLPPPPLEACPEDIPLDIVFEDEHVIVVNKSADLVMHPSPGHYSGTLVNALLHHCGLSAVKLGPGATPPQSLEQQQQPQQSLEEFGTLDSRHTECTPTDNDDDDDDDYYSNGMAISVSELPLLRGTGGAPEGGASTGVETIRPGIVHRLDKGTTGLVVVAKTDIAHASLCRQFKDRTVGRIYYSITLGLPQPGAGRVKTNIGRDFRDRKKMAAFAYASTRGRTSSSNYEVLETVAEGRAALVAWRLDTGRTHQIRVHAKHLGHPLVGDEIYNGSGGAALSVLGAGKSSRIASAQRLLKELARPALHAKTLSFEHPTSGERLRFDSEMPRDFLTALETLRADLA